VTTNTFLHKGMTQNFSEKKHDASKKGMIRNFKNLKNCVDFVFQILRDTSFIELLVLVEYFAMFPPLYPINRNGISLTSQHFSCLVLDYNFNWLNDLFCMNFCLDLFKLFSFWILNEPNKFNHVQICICRSFSSLNLV
jgi:hypothetical protein